MFKNNESKDFKIFDMSGKLIRSGNISEGQINVENLPLGVYLIHVGKTVKRFIKQ